MKNTNTITNANNIKEAKLMKNMTLKATTVVVLLLLSVVTWASDDFDEQRPDGVGDKKWSSLKMVVQEAKLLPTPVGIGGEGGWFGHSVSVDGNRALVGGTNLAESGAALVLEFDGVNWQQVAALLPADGAAGDYFGWSVSLSGDRALVGARYDDDNGINSGSAYVFDYDGVSAWSESAKLTAGDGAAGDLFGFSVSLSGDRALVGAYHDDDNGSNSGSAYVFDYDGVSAWSESIKLTAGDGAADDYFGWSVSLSGDRALVGARYDDDNGTDSGSAYVFDYDGVSSWSESAKLTAGDGAAEDYFGYSVSLSGDRALVGAYGDDDNGNASGSAYVFDYDGVSAWSESAKLTAGDGAADDYFGWSVSLSGDRALVGARYDDDNGTDSGSAYVFDYDGVSSWSESAKLTVADGAAYDYFGYSVSLSGDRALVGAYRDDDNGTDSGSAYVFDYDGVSAWSESAKLTAGDGAAGDYFGGSVSLSGDRALVGARYDDDNGNESGSAYMFDYDGVSAWSESAKLTAGDGAAEDYFGWSVSLSGDRALVGAYGDDNNGSESGSAYVFDYDGVSAWSESAKLTAGDGAADDYFGYSVSLSGDRALVGAYGDDDNGSNSGSAYVFDYDGVSAWSESIKLTAGDGAAYDLFGYSVSLSGDRTLVGAFRDDDCGTDSGSSYVLKLAPKFNVNVTVNGLAPGNSIIVSNGDVSNAVNDVSNTTSFNLYDGSAFAVTSTNPTQPNQVCTVTGGNSGNNDGTGILAGQDVAVTITCVTTQYNVNITVSGLAASNSISFTDGTNTANFNTNETQTISTLNDGSAFNVSISSAQPDTPNQVCSFTNANSGNLNGADVSIAVSCVTNEYSIGGTVSGLATNNFVTLTVNAGDEFLVVDNNTSFQFLDELPDGEAYDVTVLSNPTTPNQVCTVNNGSGQLVGAAVTDIEVNCEISTYLIGGYITGLIPDNFMVLRNNLMDDLVVTDEGAFVFNTPLNDQESYNITIQSQPIDPIQNCEVINGGGTLSGNDIGNVFISCEFGDDLIFRHGFDTPEAISRALWAPDDNKQ